MIDLDVIKKFTKIITGYAIGYDIVHSPAKPDEDSIIEIRDDFVRGGVNRLLYFIANDDNFEKYKKSRKYGKKWSDLANQYHILIDNLTTELEREYDIVGSYEYDVSMCGPGLKLTMTAQSLSILNEESVSKTTVQSSISDFFAPSKKSVKVVSPKPSIITITKILHFTYTSGTLHLTAY